METQNSVILLVEDDLNDALLAQKALRKAGISHPIIHLNDGEEAIKYFSGEAPFDDRAKHPLPMLVLLDLKMPKLTGFDVLTWLQNHPELAASIPVVVLTGSIHPEDIANAKKLGAVGYEVKPVNFAQLVSMAETLRFRIAKGPDQMPP